MLPSLLAYLMQKSDFAITSIVATCSHDNFNFMKDCFQVEMHPKLENFFKEPLTLKNQCRIVINQSCNSIEFLNLPRPLRQFLKFE